MIILSILTLSVSLRLGPSPQPPALEKQSEKNTPRRNDGLKKVKHQARPSLFLDLLMIIFRASQLEFQIRLIELTKLPQLLWGFALTFASCFQFRLAAAAYPLMSNHQCMYPRIPVLPAANPVAICLSASRCVSTARAHQQVRATLQKPTFSHVLCLSVSDALVPLSFSPSYSLTLSVSLFLAFPLCAALAQNPSDPCVLVSVLG